MALGLGASNEVRKVATKMAKEFAETYFAKSELQDSERPKAAMAENKLDLRAIRASTIMSSLLQVLATREIDVSAQMIGLGT